ncbi:hypothetical protein DPMN_064651 [Dreissena polymorpha]|uniref:Uncharacterized protein n=1 Tax=Dreissena polymorpha TaxID=45954 RepID=A0A9D4CCL0_DREPO|nr:hypothetical protein DPMN_064651 [Dreissena polymorpha]
MYTTSASLAFTARITPVLEFLSTYLIEPVTAIFHGDITAFYGVPRCIAVTKVVSMLG